MSDDETTPKMLARLGTDAMLWAQEFNKTAVKLGYSEMDEGWLIGWFANAIESCDVIRCNQLRAELAARLAPVEDEALVEIAAKIFGTVLLSKLVRDFMHDDTKKAARAAIASIRPHIEAAERERCAKIAEGFSSNRDWVPGSLWGNIRNEIAAAIRSRK